MHPKSSIKQNLSAKFAQNGEGTYLDKGVSTIVSFQSHHRNSSESLNTRSTCYNSVPYEINKTVDIKV